MPKEDMVGLDEISRYIAFKHIMGGFYEETSHEGLNLSRAGFIDRVVGTCKAQTGVSDDVLLSRVFNSYIDSEVHLELERWGFVNGAGSHETYLRFRDNALRGFVRRAIFHFTHPGKEGDYWYFDANREYFMTDLEEWMIV